MRTIDHTTLARLRAEAEERTLFLCDVRSPEEYVAGHPPGAASTPGGQLVQATDACLGTRNARVVLVDDDGVRATITASWGRRPASRPSPPPRLRPPPRRARVGAGLP